MNRKGIALVVVLLVIPAMLIMAGILFSSSINEHNISQRFFKAAQAFWLAEAGIQNAFYALSSAGLGGWTKTGEDSYQKTESMASGSYSVTINCASCVNPTAISVGSVEGVQRTLAARFKTRSSLRYAAFAKGSLIMSGNGKTDSYDSSIGAYGGNNKGSNGDIGSNGTSTGIITLSGNATVNGDAGTGPGGTVELNNNASVTGAISQDNDLELASVEVPECLTSLTGSSIYSATSNESKTISSGNYRYSSLAISGNAKVTVTGTVTLYLTGSNSLSITGNGKLTISSGGNLVIYTDGVCNIGGNGIANSTSLPQNFILKSTYSGDTGVNITGNANLQGVLYAPDTGILNSGNGSIFGSITGETITISGNGDIHYDESLTHVADFNDYAMDNWTDENNPYPL